MDTTQIPSPHGPYPSLSCSTCNQMAVAAGRVSVQAFLDATGPELAVAA